MSYTFSRYNKLPKEVFEHINSEIWNYKQTNLNIIETSHRSPVFANVNSSTIDTLRSYLSIPPNYKIVLAQGGSELFFASVPYNLLITSTKKARYVVSGPRSELAYKEAALIGGSDKVVAVTETEILERKDLGDEFEYTYFCMSDIQNGKFLRLEPQNEKEVLIADCNSVLGLIDIDISRFGIVFSSAEYSLGIAGTTIVAFREDLLGREHKNCPSMFSFEITLKMNSIFNTPNCFAVYSLGQNVKHLHRRGFRNVEKHVQNLRSQLMEGVRDRSIWEITSDSPTVVVLEKKDSSCVEATLTKLESQHLMITKTSRNGKIKIHLYPHQTADNIRQLLEVLHN